MTHVLRRPKIWTLLMSAPVLLGAGVAPAQALVDGDEVLDRVGPDVPGATPIVHVHGFAISGEDLMPTARLLPDQARQPSSRRQSRSVRR